MSPVKQILFYTFLVVVLATGLWCVFAPESAIGFRRRMGWPEDFWSGGYFYATPFRARVTGALVVIVALFALLLALAKSWL